jgi:hypothetical protein
LSVRLRPFISRTAGRVRQQVAKVDNPEVRKARTLVRQAARTPGAILELGDSMVSWIAPYDTDRRPFHRMLRDSFGADAPMHVVHGGSYNPPLYDQYLRLIEGHPPPSLVVVPLTPRVRTLPWIEHPAYGHRKAIDFLSTVDPAGPARRIRTGIPPATPEEFARFYALPFPTWAGDLTIGDYVHPIKRGELSLDEATTLLYAYHHGGEIVPGAPLDMVRDLGARLRRLGAPVVVYQTPVPVEKGVELHGPAFRELAERNFATLEDAFVDGYGDIEVLRTGLDVPTSHFIDWRDGSEHLNEHGRSTIAAAVVDAAKSLRA